MESSTELKEILDTFYKIVTQENNEEEFREYFYSLSERDYKRLEKFGRLLVELAEIGEEIANEKSSED